MNPDRQDELAIARQAAEWLTALQEGGDASAPAAFADWIAQSPVNVREFLNATAIHCVFEDFDSQRQIDVNALLQESPGNVVPLQRTRSALRDLAAAAQPGVSTASAGRSHVGQLRGIL